MEKRQRGGRKDPFLNTFLDVRKTAQRELAQRTKEALEVAVPALPEMSADSRTDLVRILETHLLDRIKQNPNAKNFGVSVARFPETGHDTHYTKADLGMVHLMETCTLSKNAWWKEFRDWNEKCFNNRFRCPRGAIERHNELLKQALEQVCVAWNTVHPKIELMRHDPRTLVFVMPKN
jgi:hypothetical protein